MNQKVSKLVIFMLLLSFLFSACAPAPAAAPTQPVVPTAEPTAVPPTATAVPPTATPEPAPDIEALFTDLVAQLPADKGYGSVGATKLNEEMIDKAPFLLDVREASEVEKDGYIEGAVHIPVRDVLKNLDKLPAMDQPIVVYCASGHRGGFVLSALRLLGYSNVRNLGGGLGAWKKAELPVETGLPEAPAAGTAPEIENQALFTMLDDYLSNLPDGFNAMKADSVNVALVEGTPFLIDLRPAKDYDEGYIAGAVNIPFEELFTRLNELPEDKNTQIILYCGSGHRGGIVLPGLQLLGYTKVANLGGGMGAWKAAKLPVEGWVDWNATWGDFLAGMPGDFYSTSATDVNAAMADKDPFLLDVREASEVEKDGYIEGAVHIPVRDVLKNLDKLPAKDQRIIVYCASGHRGGLVMPALRMLGYTDVVNLGGGLGAWKKAELPVVTGSMPEEPAAGTAPEVDQTMFEQLDAFLSGLPEGFYTVKAADLNAAMVEDEIFVLDVRTEGELAKDGMIEDSVHIPVNEVFTRMSELPTDKAAPIVVLCKSGHRGAIAMMALRMNGYTDVRNLGGGINAWIAAELPVAQPVP